MLQALFAEALERGGRCPSLSIGAHTILIPKCEDVTKLQSVNGYRPITLTNVDYKIFMKVQASRLQSVIGDLVGSHQTCGICGRSILTNILVARSIFEYCDSEVLRVAMLQIDLSKAFDQVLHEVLFLFSSVLGSGRYCAKVCAWYTKTAQQVL